MAKAKAPNKGPDEMSEVELAEHFYAHRHDLAGEEVTSRTPARMDVMISARFSPAEAVKVRAAATRARMSVSAFLRQGVLAALDTKVVDLGRLRADLLDLRAKADQALAVLADDSTLVEGSEAAPRPQAAPRRPSAPKRKAATG